jgi:CheY-like chemotaxis protein
MVKILIIDDDRDIIEGLSLVLESHGYQVAAKSDVEALVPAVRAVDPDLIILDVIFPDDPRAGFEAARALHREPSLSHIPVLVLSAVNQLSNLGFSFTEMDISEDFLPVGGFMEKPVEPARLLEKVRALLGAP